MAHVKSICLSFFHKNTNLAYTGFVKPIEEVSDNSPYFNHMISNHDIRLICDGERSNTTIGRDVIFYVLSEINFVNNREISKYKITQAFSRMEARFPFAMNYIGGIIFDSSVRGDDSVLDEFIKENNLGDNFISVKASIWEAKAHQGIYFNKGSFKVYTGDSLHFPFIIKDESDITPDMDRDRIVECPMELYKDFERDIITAIQDKMGRSTVGNDSFMPDPTSFINSCKIAKLNDDVIQVDFYDKSDKLSYKLSRALDRIPKDRILYSHIDLGLKKDYTGFSIAYFDHWILSDKGVKEPYFICPLIVAISRKPGQETSIYHIRDLINDIAKNYEFGQISFDTYQSRSLEQDLIRDGFNVKTQSLDRTDKIYNTFKGLIYNGQVEMARNDRFINEVTHLMIVDPIKGKIDHHPVGSMPDDGSCSKDIADSVAGSVFSAFDNLELSKELSGTYKSKLQLDALSALTSDLDNTEQKFNNMLQNIF